MLLLLIIIIVFKKLIVLFNTDTKQCCTKIGALLKQKNYSLDGSGGLQQPSTIFYSICCLQIAHFKENFSKNYFIKNIKKSFVQNVIKLTNKTFPDWFQISHECYSHRVELLKFVLLVLIRKNCKWILAESTNKKKDRKFAKKLKKIT